MTKEPLPTTHNAEHGARSTCREEPKTGPSLEAFEHQHDYSGVQKIIWRANMEKTAWRNIMSVEVRVIRNRMVTQGAETAI